MAWMDDLKTLIVAAGAPAANVFKSSQAKIPPTGGPYISIIETGGTNPDRTQNVDGDAYENPSAMILARGTDYEAARTLLSTIYTFVGKVQNQTVNGTWYVSIRPMQSQFTDLLPDEIGRARVAFNVLGNKRP